MWLDWQIIKAMVWVETGADSSDWHTKPMQIGVPGDLGLTSFLSAEEGGGLILTPAWRERLNPSTVRTVPGYNIRAGIGYLLMRMASFEYRSSFDAGSKEYDVTVEPGDSFDRIAKDQKSTVEILKQLNPKVIMLYAGQTIRCWKGLLKKVITSWRHITTESIARRYNEGGRSHYAQKLDFALSLIRSKNKMIIRAMKTIPACIEADSNA